MKKIIKNILQYIAVIVISLVIAILLRLFVVDFYSIPSDSMQPTIEPGDFIMVNKLSFGARMYKNFDFLKDRTEPETYRIKGFSKIHNGDVLVFNFPYSGGWDRISMHLSRFYVKRCIGIPGDSLQIKGGFYEINGRRGIGNLNDHFGSFGGVLGHFRVVLSCFGLFWVILARDEFYFMVKWLCAPRGPEVGRGVSIPPSLPLDSTLPATS